MANDPAMAHVKSTMRTPASGWRWSPPAPSPPGGGRALGQLVEQAVVGAEQRRRPALAAPEVRAERRAGEPDPLAVGLVDVDEEVAGREVGVLGDVARRR